MGNSQQLSHLDDEGRSRMVDVSLKADTERVAVAKGEVHMQPETLSLIRSGNLKKGDVFSVAQLAGVMAAKRTAELVPLCHPLPLTHVVLELVASDNLGDGVCGIVVIATVRAIAKTGVEMEAMMAVSVAALTVYDMTKSIEKTMRIANVRLVEKRGGVSGDVVNE